MVYGDPNKEQIVLNDKSLWSGSKIDHDIPGGHVNLLKSANTSPPRNSTKQKNL